MHDFSQKCDLSMQVPCHPFLENSPNELQAVLQALAALRKFQIALGVIRSLLHSLDGTRTAGKEGGEGEASM